MFSFLLSLVKYLSLPILPLFYFLSKRERRTRGIERVTLNVDLEKKERRRRALDCIGYRCLESYYQPGPFCPCTFPQYIHISLHTRPTTLIFLSIATLLFSISFSRKRRLSLTQIHSLTPVPSLSSP